MTEAGPETADTPQPAKGRPKRIGRSGRRVLWFLLAAIPIAAVLIAGFLFWAVSTESGSRFVILSLARYTGVVTMDGWRGRMLDKWRADRIVVRLPDMRIEAHAIEVDWRLRSLLNRQVALDRLQVDTLHIRAAPKPEEPRKAPTSLRLPVSFYVTELRAGLLSIGELSDAGNPLPASQEFRDIKARMDSDGAEHRVHDLSLGWMAGRLAANGRIGVTTPFPLHVNASWAGNLSERKLALSAQARGNLLAPSVQVDIQGEGVKGNADVTLQPFEPLPLREAVVNIVGLNPADFHAQAPQAELDIKTNLRPRLPRGAPALPKPSDWAVSGPVEVVNRMPKAIDDNGIPLQRLSTKLDWAGGRLTVDALNVLLAGGGQLAGEGSWQPTNNDLIGRILGEVKLVNVDPSKIANSAQATLINGSVSARANAERQDFSADLTADRYRLVASGMQADQVLRLSSAELTAGNSRLHARGQLRLDGNRAFRAEGDLQHGNPQVFAASAMKGDINATFNVSGHLSPQWQARMQLSLAPSTLGQYPLTGRADVALAPQRISSANAQLDVFGNRIDIHGAFGRVGDELKFLVDAAHLERLLNGASGHVKLEGSLRDTLAQPSGEVRASATAVALASGVKIDSVVAHARLERGINGELDASATLNNLSAGQEERQTYVHSLTLTAKGTRQSNVISLDANLWRDETIRALAQGRLADGAWTGRLQEFSARGPIRFALEKPTALELSGDRVSLGPSVLVAQNGRIELQQTDWTPSRVVARGRITGVEVGLALDENQRTVVRGRSLQLGGDWNIELGARANALVRVFREDGDFILGGDQPVALGLRDLDMNLAVQDGRLTATALVNGSRIGTINAVLSAATEGSGPSVRLDPNAPLVGVVNMAVPSISWVGPLIDQNYRTDGAVRAEFNILGTPSNPQGNGRIVGEKMEFALADEGLRLTEGDLLVSFDANRVRLERLNFRSPNAVDPPDSRLVTLFRNRAGSIQGNGELALQTGKGNFRVEAERVGVLQRTDQWVVVSGVTRIDTAWDSFDMNAELRADAGFIGVQRDAVPKLSEDVSVRGRPPKEARRMKVNATIAFDFGNRFILKAHGIDTFLDGKLRIEFVQGSPPLGFGSVLARNGVFDAYGQKLAIDRGAVNFAGPLDNPGLNVVAIREGLPVEAGVEVTGTAQNPRVRLVSDPEVPDAEKLSWILLGRPTEIGAGDAGLLLSAASAAFGDGGEGAVDRVARGLGLDEIGIGQGSSAAARPLDSRVASSATGLGSSINTPGSINEQVLTIGKRLSSRAHLSLEQNFTGTESVIKLTYQLSRYLALIARAGTENALDLSYSVSFR